MLRSRLAPTPSGFLHEGNALNFVLTWLAVRKENGVLRLRIDDLDAARVEEQYVDDIFNTLHWLGIDWDEGPLSTAEHFRSFSQKLRVTRYQELIDKLRGKDLLFACTCSRKDILALSTGGKYPGTCCKKKLPFDAPETSWRLYRTEEPMAYPIIRRRDGIPSSYIASLADDLDQGVNLIVRGDDLRPVTTLQLELASLLGEDHFKNIRFEHHALLTDAAGNKLSKSAGSVSLKARIERGESPERLYEKFSEILGLKEKARAAGELLRIAGAQ